MREHQQQPGYFSLITNIMEKGILQKYFSWDTVNIVGNSIHNQIFWGRVVVNFVD